ncbi:MAG: sugar kinase, partial [Caulobacteraceae bacterium]
FPKLAAEVAVIADLDALLDGNFRGKLWEQWEGDPPATLGKMLSGATVAFADDRDFALVLKTKFDSADPAVRRREAAKAAFTAFPRLQRIACTLRVQDSVADQALSAVMLTRATPESDDGVIETNAEAIHMAGVVDRVGGGDAFASGVLFGLWSGWSDQEALDFGLAAAGLKHSVPGDFNLFTADEVRAAMGDGGFDIRR